MERATFSLGGKSINCNIHYHFKQGTGPETTLSLLRQRDDPNNYLGVVGCTNNASYAEINLAGGFAEIDYNLTGFSGKFIRV